MMRKVVKGVIIGDASEVTLVASGVSLKDTLEMPTQREMRDSGQMIAPCAFARTGSQVYSAKAVGLSGDPTRPVTLFRDEADVFDPASMESFRSVPVTIGHPKDAAGELIDVTSENAKELQVGTLEGMPVRDEDNLTGNLVIARQDAIDLIEEGTAELSAGYKCDVELVVRDGEEVMYQRNIVANHIAIVAKARGGSGCVIADAAEETPAEAAAEPVVLADAAELITKVTVLTDEVESLKSKVVVSGEALASVALALQLGDEEVTEAVVLAKVKSMVDETCAVLLAGAHYADSVELDGLSISEMKRAILADHLGKDLDRRDDDYVRVRFSMMVEDEGELSAMERNLKPASEVVLADAVEVDPVVAARRRMQLNQSKQFKK